MSVPGRRSSGTSLFEVAIGAAIVALLAGVLANRLLFYQEQSEVVAAEQLIGTLRGALQAKYGAARVTQDERERAALGQQNPISWLMRTPGNYLGEYFSPRIDELPKGNWYYDRANKTLVYIFNSRKTFPPEPLKLLKFKVKSFHFPANSQQIVGLTDSEDVALEQVVEFSDVSKNKAVSVPRP